MKITFDHHTTVPESDGLPVDLWNQDVSLTVTASVCYERTTRDSPGGLFIDIEEGSIAEADFPYTKDLEIRIFEAIHDREPTRLEELAAEAFDDERAARRGGSL